MIDLLFYMILGHFFGDFALQTDRMASEKGRSKAVLTHHVILYTLTLSAFLLFGLLMNGDSSFFSWITLVVVAIIFTAHWFQDYLKASKFNGTKQAFYLDQAVHILILFLIRILVYNGQA